MAKKVVEPLEQHDSYSTKQVAAQVGVEPVTVRKYSGMAENASKNKDLFRPTGDTSRAFSTDDIEKFKRIVALTKNSGVSLANAIKTVFIEQSATEKSKIVGTVNLPQVANMERVEALLGRTFDSNDRLSAEVAELKTQNEQILSKLDDLTTGKNAKVKRHGIFGWFKN